MKIKSIRDITGPSMYHNKPLLMMKLDLQELTEVSSADLKDFNERLLHFLPGLIEHRCSPGYRGGFVERLQRGTYFAHIVEHVSLELSELAGIPVGYGKAVYDGAEGQYQVIVRYKSKEGMEFLLTKAVEFLKAIVNNEPYSIDELVAEAKDIIRRAAFGPSTQAIIDAANRRNIPWKRLNDQSLIQFGYGKHRKWIQATTTDDTNDIAVDIVQNKNLTKKLLDSVSLPVPRGEVVYSLEEAMEAFESLRKPLAVKPIDGNHGRGVSLNITTVEALNKAYFGALDHSRGVIVEECVKGNDYRILLVGGKFIAASHRIPAYVTGDGVKCISELVEEENKNPLRGEGHDKPLTKISVNPEDGIDTTLVPAEGERVYLKETANLSTGGLAEDVTDVIHPELKNICERAARIVGLNICGIDLIAEDITRSASEQTLGIIEVNAGPGIRMHHYPSKGKARDVGAAIVDNMFPQNSNGRIPIVSITGTNGKTTVTRLVNHILVKSGQNVGTTTSDGIMINSEVIATGDTTGPISARTILDDPLIDVAVLETARGGIMKRGLAFDWSDVGIITNIQADHLGQDGIESVEDILKVKSIIAERVREGGAVILNAECPYLMELSRNKRMEMDKKNLILFSLDDQNPALQRHIHENGSAYFLRGEEIYSAINGQESRICNITEIPLTLGGTARFHAANAMCAMAACRSLGMKMNEVVESLKSFIPNEQNHGRANLFKLNRGHVLLDFGHNPQAILSIGEMVKQWNTSKLTCVMSAPGDRTDEMIEMCGEAAGRVFDKLVLREDDDLRGRASGEIPALLKKGILKVNPTAEIEIITDGWDSKAKAYAAMNEGELVVDFYDAFQSSRDYLVKRGAVEASMDSLIKQTFSTPFMTEGSQWQNLH